MTITYTKIIKTSEYSTSLGGGVFKKVVAWPIEMVCWMEKNGTIHLVRFKIEDNDVINDVIKIDRVTEKNLEKFAGNLTYVYKCQSIINGVIRPYEIKYEINTSKWMLFKI